MSVTFLSFILGFGQGLLHAVGPDHCAAMVTLGTGRAGPAHTFKTALRFALGHALVLGSVATFCLLAGVGLSETFERWAEIGGGVILIGLAVAAILFPGALRHGHPHVGPHGPEHVHPKIPLAAGALMALSGVRSLLLAVPPLVVGGSASVEGWTFLPGFTLGILAGMGGIGLLVSATLGRLSDRLLTNVHRAAALATAGVGVFWVAIRL